MGNSAFSLMLNMAGGRSKKTGERSYYEVVSKAAYAKARREKVITPLSHLIFLFYSALLDFALPLRGAIYFARMHATSVCSDVDLKLYGMTDGRSTQPVLDGCCLVNPALLILQSPPRELPTLNQLNQRQDIPFEMPNIFWSPSSTTFLLGVSDVRNMTLFSRMPRSVLYISGCLMIQESIIPLRQISAKIQRTGRTGAVTHATWLRLFWPEMRSVDV